MIQGLCWKAVAPALHSHSPHHPHTKVAIFEPSSLASGFSLAAMYTRSSLILLLFISFAAEVHAQENYVLTDTVPHYFLGVRAVTSPLANGFEVKYVRDVKQAGEELSIFISGSSLNARQFCSEFTDSARTTLAITDNLPFDRDISRYEIDVFRQNLFAVHYSTISYSKKRTFGFRRSLGFRMTRWQVETSNRPFFPSGFISFAKCGEGDGLFGSSPPRRYEAVNVVNTTTAEGKHLVYSLEAGVGFSYRTSPARRLMLAFEGNVFGLLPLNEAKLTIDSPVEGSTTDYSLETIQQIGISLDLSVGLIFKIR